MALEPSTVADGICARAAVDVHTKEWNLRSSDAARASWASETEEKQEESTIGNWRLAYVTSKVALSSLPPCSRHHETLQKYSLIGRRFDPNSSL